MLGLSCSMWDIVPWPGIEPGPPALGAQNLSHRTTREVPQIVGLFEEHFGSWKLLEMFVVRHPETKSVVRLCQLGVLEYASHCWKMIGICLLALQCNWCPGPYSCVQWHEVAAFPRKLLWNKSGSHPSCVWVIQLQHAYKISEPLFMVRSGRRFLSHHLDWLKIPTF